MNDNFEARLKAVERKLEVRPVTVVTSDPDQQNQLDTLERQMEAVIGILEELQPGSRNSVEQKCNDVRIDELADVDRAASDLLARSMSQDPRDTE